MIVSTVWDSFDAAMLALTASERWAATRKIHPRSAEEYSSILAIALLLLALVLLLWLVSRKRNVVPPVPASDLFSDAAERRGLGPRERHILLAIVARSGLQRSQDIFITPDAFDQGAAKLLDECAHSRTPEETERLRVEMAGLRERLVYRVTGKGEQVENDRADRLSVQAPAVVARFPFVQAATMESGDMVPTDWFELVRGVVTQVSNSSLQIRSPLEVQVGERVLVVFTLAPGASGEATRDAEPREHVISHVGRVRYRQAAGGETEITVNLIDLTAHETDELVRLAKTAVSDVPAGLAHE
jgi:hypothetical protein